MYATHVHTGFPHEKFDFHKTNFCKFLRADKLKRVCELEFHAPIPNIFSCPLLLNVIILIEAHLPVAALSKTWFVAHRFIFVQDESLYVSQIQFLSCMFDRHCVV